jgi:hypothetical protein
MTQVTSTWGEISGYRNGGKLSYVSKTWLIARRLSGKKVQHFGRRITIEVSGIIGKRKKRTWDNLPFVQYCSDLCASETWLRRSMKHKLLVELHPQLTWWTEAGRPVCRRTKWEHHTCCTSYYECEGGHSMTRCQRLLSQDWHATCPLCNFRFTVSMMWYTEVKTFRRTLRLPSSVWISG